MFILIKKTAICSASITKKSFCVKKNNEKQKIEKDNFNHEKKKRETKDAKRIATLRIMHLIELNQKIERRKKTRELDENFWLCRVEKF